MDINRFKQVLGTFLESSEQLQIERGTLVMQFAGELIEAQLLIRDGSLYVVQDGATMRAEEWIVRRVAMLDLLVERILSAIQPNRTFVVPAGELLDDVEKTPDETITHVSDAVAAVETFLSRRPGGTCSVLYLTSDAGEGKTTLIHELARRQAEKFKSRAADWLLVPVNLAGRPFLRFDDVIVAALMNQLRFQRLYFDAFLQLVRMGVVVPALDGFEEVFVETSEGDAVSSLGTLIRQLAGEGTLLIAARKAYFEYRNLETQARLLDALPDMDVLFGRVSLDRWGKHEFIRYCDLNGLPDAEAFYDALAAKVTPTHPLITRAVLVKRLVEIAAASSDRSFVESITPEANRFFVWLVDKLLEREAYEKWIDKHGESPKPLLSLHQHHELLSSIAEEMWISKTGLLSSGMLDSLAELFCEAQNLSPVTSRQVKERLKQHALIVAVGQSHREFSFDHDDFRQFFLGEQISQHIRLRHESDLRKLFRIELLPSICLDTAVHFVGHSLSASIEATAFVARLGVSEGSSTFVRENAGAVVIRLLENTQDTPSTIDGLMFPLDSLNGKRLRNLNFKNCYFRPTDLDHTQLIDCIFTDCEFEHLGLFPTSSIEACQNQNSRVHSMSVTHDGDTVDYYNPEQISVALSRRGIASGSLQLSFEPDNRLQIDEKLRIAEKAIHTFHRCTHVSEGTFRLRLSVHANHFFDEVLPDLLRVGVLEEATRGPVSTPKYRLAISLSKIAGALSKAKGSYENFLASVRSVERLSAKP